MSRHFFQWVIVFALMWLCAATTAQAKAAPPKQVHSIRFEWGSAAAELSIHRQPKQHPRATKPIRQFYRATIDTPDGKQETRQVEGRPILPSREADVQMLRYGDIRAEFTEGAPGVEVQLGRDPRVLLHSPTTNSPISVKTGGLHIRLHTEQTAGTHYLCTSVTPRRGKPRHYRTALSTGAPDLPAIPISSIRPGLYQPGYKLYLRLQIGPLHCIWREDGTMTICEPEPLPGL